jgi:hypothetical protein
VWQNEHAGSENFKFISYGLRQTDFSKIRGQIPNIFAPLDPYNCAFSGIDYSERREIVTDSNPDHLNLKHLNQIERMALTQTRTSVIFFVNDAAVSNTLADMLHAKADTEIDLESLQQKAKATFLRNLQLYTDELNELPRRYPASLQILVIRKLTKESLGAFDAGSVPVASTSMSLSEIAGFLDSLNVLEFPNSFGREWTVGNTGKFLLKMQAERRSAKPEAEKQLTHPLAPLIDYYVTENLKNIERKEKEHPGPFGPWQPAPFGTPPGGGFGHFGFGTQ